VRESLDLPVSWRIFSEAISKLTLVIDTNRMVGIDIHGELGHGVRNLLEQDGTETGVEGSGTLFPQDTAETADETVGESGLRNETDTGSLEGAEGNVGKELGDGGGTEVDGRPVLTGLLETESVDGLLLPELVTGCQLGYLRRRGNSSPSELEGTLNRVTDNGGAETGQKSASTLSGDNLTEGGDHSLQISNCPASKDNSTYAVVHLGLELDPGLDDIDGGEGTVGDGTSKGTGKGEPATVRLQAPIPQFFGPGPTHRA
jgi:hypothetical protein